MRETINLVGQKFGRLTVIKRAESTVTPNGTTRTMWLCQCDCGEQITAAGHHLRAGKIVSCGCYNDELKRSRATHHQSHTRIYNIWMGMRSRCNYSKNNRYDQYGARGIRVCFEWEHDFKAFYSWAISHGYTDELSIDRIDVNGNYCPENCRWETTQAQSENRTDNVLYSLSGEEQPISYWCREYGKKQPAVRWRLSHGWTIEEALDIIPRSK